MFISNARGELVNLSKVFSICHNSLQAKVIASFDAEGEFRTTLFIGSGDECQEYLLRLARALVKAGRALPGETEALGERESGGVSKPELVAQLVDALRGAIRNAGHTEACAGYGNLSGCICWVRDATEAIKAAEG